MVEKENIPECDLLGNDWNYLQNNTTSVKLYNLASSKCTYPYICPPLLVLTWVINSSSNTIIVHALLIAIDDQETTPKRVIESETANAVCKLHCYIPRNSSWDVRALSKIEAVDICNTTYAHPRPSKMRPDNRFLAGSTPNSPCLLAQLFEDEAEERKASNHHINKPPPPAHV